MKQITRNLAAAMMVMLCAVAFAVAANNAAPIAPPAVQSIQTQFSAVAPAMPKTAVNASTATNVERSLNNSVCDFSQTGIAVNADFNDYQMIGRHSATNELMTIIHSNFSQSAFNPSVNRYLIKPVPKLIVTVEGDQRFYRRE